MEARTAAPPSHLSKAGGERADGNRDGAAAVAAATATTVAVWVQVVLHSLFP